MEDETRDALSEGILSCQEAGKEEAAAAVERTPPTSEERREETPNVVSPGVPPLTEVLASKGHDVSSIAGVVAAVTVAVAAADVAAVSAAAQIHTAN